jgi:phosphate acyltransferase
LQIGVDLTGGDTTPHLLFEAVLQAADAIQSHSVGLVAFATPSLIDEINGRPDWNERLARAAVDVQFHPVGEVIAMKDDPMLSIRRKKGSALVVGMNLLESGGLHAFVSSGNTGALITSAVLTLPSLPGIHRPALLAMLPTAKSPVAVIDVGGHVSCKADNLVQFAYMGAAYQRCFHQIALPRVGLLNIGVESKKGTTEVREAYHRLQQYSKEHTINFIGNVEGREVFQGGVDVLVTDGFTGNVFLKTSEGISSLIIDHLKGSIDKEALPGFQRLFSYDEYPGAVLCGVEGVVIKCHGLTSTKGMLNAILGAFNLVQNQFVNVLKNDLG